MGKPISFFYFNSYIYIKNERRKIIMKSLTYYGYNIISEKINKGILKKIILEEGERVFTAVKVNSDDNTFGLYEINYGTLFEEPVSFFAYDRESLLILLNNHMMSDRFKLFSVEFCEKSD